MKRNRQILPLFFIDEDSDVLRRPQMSRAGSDEHRASVSWVQHHMAYDVAKDHRPGQFPRPAGAIAAQDEGTLAYADQ